jgi:uncharacterized protein YbcI
MRGLVAPTEKILMEQDQVYSVQHTRDLLMKTLIPEIKACQKKFGEGAFA